MKNYFKYLCLAGSLTALTLVASCSKDNDEEENTPTPQEVTGISFATQVKPLIEANCTPCHTDQGTQTNYTLYANAKNNIDLIIDRTQRNPNDEGFMPIGASEQKTALIEMLKQWKTDDFPQ